MTLDPSVNEPAHLRLPEELGIYAAADLGRAMAALLAAPGEPSAATAVRIDTTAVQTVDTSGVQLLIAFVSELTRRGLAWQWSGASRPVHEAAQRLGVLGLLKLTPIDHAA